MVKYKQILTVVTIVSTAVGILLALLTYIGTVKTKTKAGYTEQSKSIQFLIKRVKRNHRLIWRYHHNRSKRYRPYKDRRQRKWRDLK